MFWWDEPLCLNESSLHVDLALSVDCRPSERFHLALQSHLLPQSLQLLTSKEVVERIIPPPVPVMLWIFREQAWLCPSCILLGMVPNLTQIAIRIISEQDMPSVGVRAEESGERRKNGRVKMRWNGTQHKDERDCAWCRPLIVRWSIEEGGQGRLLLREVEHECVDPCVVIVSVRLDHLNCPL